MSCPSPELLRRSLDADDSMADSERQRIEAHVDGCQQGCKQVITDLLRANVLLGGSEGARPASAALAPAAPVPAKVVTDAPGEVSRIEDPQPLRLGRYTLQKLLGKGGMGDVYLAHDTQLDRPVALKIPRFGPSPRPEDEERFLREARAAAMLSHPNLCPVYDAGRTDGVSYLAMAYVEGKPLSELLRDDPHRPIQDAVRLVSQLARAMQEAHRRGVIHRDLKPANVMIDPRGQPVIMDFGLARRGLETGDVRLTQSGVIMGTPTYMSPEQVNGAVSAMGPACDIYSLGVILYELLTGRPPFTGTLGELMAQITAQPPPPPTLFRPGLDPDLEAICLKALAKTARLRFGSMEEFANALEDLSRRTAQRSAAGAGPAPSPTGNVRTPAPSPEGDERLRLCLAARYYLEKRTEEAHRKSIATYYQVLDRDPTFAPAWAGLAFAYHLLSVWGYASPTNACPRAKSAALRALALDNSQGEAHRVLATVLMEYDWDLAGAEQAFHRALELKPDDADAHRLHGKCLACQGRHPEAIAELRRAEDLDPLSPLLSTDLGRHGYFLARMYDQAVRQYQKTLELDPTFWLAHRFLGWAYLFQGKMAEAVTEFTTARRLNDYSLTLAGLGYAYAISGQQAKAQELLDTLTEQTNHRYVSPDCQAIICIGLGDRDQAFSWLEKAVEDRSEWLCKFRVDPVLDPLRSDPRFDAMLQRMNVKL
jgi:serine/threonine protein kinase/Flp pilus assembly protein TadD